MILGLAEKDQSVLEIETLQIIIEYKWKHYTRFFFLAQLILFVVYIIFFILDTVAIKHRKVFDASDNNQLAYRIICMIIQVLLFLYEIMDFRENVRTYLQNVWNLNDILSFLCYLTFFTVSFTLPAQVYALKALQLAVTITSFIKLCFLIRIFTKLAFLVRMLVNVFYDLRYFLLFFLIVVCMFTTLIHIIVDEVEEGYEGIGALSFFVLALRQSVGDYDSSTLVSGSQYKILVWILWFLIMVVGNIVFMNFIIAVVSESYENCMERMIQSMQIAKLYMIEECESLLPRFCYDYPTWFPRYILLRRQVDSESIGGEDNEWQGFIKQMKKYFDQEGQVIRQQFKSQRFRLDDTKRLIEQTRAKSDLKVSEFKNDIRTFN